MRLLQPPLACSSEELVSGWALPVSAALKPAVLLTSWSTWASRVSTIRLLAHQTLNHAPSFPTWRLTSEPQTHTVLTESGISLKTQASDSGPLRRRSANWNESFYMRNHKHQTSGETLPTPRENCAKLHFHICSVWFSLGENGCCYGAAEALKEYKEAERGQVQPARTRSHFYTNMSFSSGAECLSEPPTQTQRKISLILRWALGNSDVLQVPEITNVWAENHYAEKEWKWFYTLTLKECPCICRKC